MKKIVTITGIFFILVHICTAAFGACAVNLYTNGLTVHSGLNYSNIGRVFPQGHAMNKVPVRATGNEIIVTPPPPPPRREIYRYKNFYGAGQFPHRNYYVPSYCIRETEFYGSYNPFCSRYRPYGNSFYLDF